MGRKFYCSSIAINEQFPAEGYILDITPAQPAEDYNLPTGNF